MPNIIVTLTTIPNRLMEPKEYMGTRLGLKTLLEQKNVEYKVHFNIPYKYKLTGEPLHIPDWLVQYQLDYTHLEIYRTEDFGSITKILPTLDRVTNPDDIIIVADDDLYYLDGMVEAHLKARRIHPNAAIGFAGIGALDGSCHFCTTLSKTTRVKILEGYKTVSYKRSFFNLEEFKKDFVFKSWDDDRVLSAYMGHKNIPKIVLSYEGDTDFRARVESFPIVSSCPIERGGCWEYRNSIELRQKSDENIKEFYRLGYLER